MKKNFSELFFHFFWSPVSRIVPKNVKGRGGALGVFEHPVFRKIENKLKGDPLETFEKFAKKSVTKPKSPAQKIFGQGRDSKPRWQTSKILRKSEAEEAILVWQLMEASLESL